MQLPLIDPRDFSRSHRIQFSRTEERCWPLGGAGLVVPTLGSVNQFSSFFLHPDFLGVKGHRQAEAGAAGHRRAGRSRLERNLSAPDARSSSGRVESIHSRLLCPGTRGEHQVVPRPSPTGDRLLIVGAAAGSAGGAAVGRGYMLQLEPPGKCFSIENRIGCRFLKWGYPGERKYAEYLTFSGGADGA